MLRPAVLALAALTLTAACGRAPATTPVTPGTGRIVDVVDGDTVVVELGSSTEHVRLLGIDTPETSHPTRPVECYGHEATTALIALVPPGTTVLLERDTEARDHFGRLLLYLYRDDDGLFVNHALVAEGFAVALHVEPNSTHRDALSRAERQAREEGRGLWGACGGPDVPVDPLATPAAGASR